MALEVLGKDGSLLKRLAISRFGLDDRRFLPQMGSLPLGEGFKKPLQRAQMSSLGTMSR